MAKEENVVITPMTKKQKWLNFLKIFGICVAVMVGIIGASVCYVWASGGFNPPYVPLESITFVAKDGSELPSGTTYQYVIDGPDEILVAPNEGCTELDAILTIKNTKIIQLVEDKNVSHYVDPSEIDDDKDTPAEQSAEEQPEGEKVYTKYAIKLGSPIKVKPQTRKITVPDGEETKEIEVNVGGWVEISVRQGLIEKNAFIFVDIPVEGIEIGLADDSEVKSTDIYAESSSVIKVSATSFSPDKYLTAGENIPKSINTPTTIQPYGATSNYVLKDANGNQVESKIVYYQVNDESKATVNSNGIVTVKSDAEGSFSVKAYVITTYNNTFKIPNLEDFRAEYGDDATAKWEEEFDKIRVWSNELVFNIKEVGVSSITTQKSGDISRDIKPSYAVFEKDILIKASNDQSVACDRNNYFVDITLTVNDSKIQKDTLLNTKTEAVAGYITRTNEEDAIVVDDKKIVLTDKFIKLEKTSSTQLTWKLSVLKYNANKNVICFRYPIDVDEDGNTKYLYAYTEIDITKVDVEGISFTNKIPSTRIVTLNKTDTSAEAFDLTSTANITPSNATYSKIMYFALASENIIQVDSKIKVTINNIDYYAICGSIEKTDGKTEQKYGYVIPTASGRTSVVAVVLETDINGNIISDEAENPIYNPIYFSDLITLEIVERPVITGWDVVDEEDTSIVNDGKVSVFAGQKFKVVVAFTGNGALLPDYDVVCEPNDKNYINVSKLDADSKSSTKTFEIDALAEGNVKISIKSDDEVLYSFNLEIVSTELRDLELSSNAQENGVGVYLDETNKTYKWVVNDTSGDAQDGAETLKFDVKYTPENPSSKFVELNAYVLKDGNFVEDKNILEIVDDDGNGSATGDVSKMQFIVHKPGTVYVSAISGSIESNKVEIVISISNGKVEFNKGNNTSATTGNKKQVVTSIEGESVSLSSYPLEGYTDENGFVYEGEKYQEIRFVNSKGQFTKDLKPFIKYKFAGEYDTVVDETGTTLVSKKTGAKIKDGMLILPALSKAKDYERIAVYTDFGYECSESEQFVYELVADYEVKEQDVSYYAPNVVDIFKDVSKTDGEGNVTKAPAFMLTNKKGDKLYLPENYHLDNLSQEFRDKFGDDNILCVLKVISYDSLYINYIDDEDMDDVGLFILKNVSEKVVTRVTISVGEQGYSYDFVFTILPAIEIELNYENLSQDPKIPEDKYENYEIGSFNFSDTVIDAEINLSQKIAFKENANAVGLASGSLHNVNLYVDASDYKVATENGIQILYHTSTTYKRTTDTEIDANHHYYTFVNNEYVLVDNPTLENISTYYEAVEEKTKYMEVFNDGGEWKLKLYRQIEEIQSVLSIKLEFEVEITSNLEQLSSIPYTSLVYYKINFKSNNEWLKPSLMWRFLIYLAGNISILS